VTNLDVMEAVLDVTVRDLARAEAYYAEPLGRQADLRSRGRTAH
jgi:hypothetical protein